MRAAEADYWWYAGLRQMLRLAVAAMALPAAPRVLDAGCGTGGNLRLLRALRPEAQLTGLDLSPHALAALEPGLCQEQVCADLNDPPAFGPHFDLIVCCDVLPHRGLRWREALGHFARWLRPGGALLLNVPALPALRGRHDEAVLLEHRFRRDELAAALEQAGFANQDVRFWNAALLPAVFVVRRGSRLFGRGRTLRSDLPLRPGPANAWLRRWIEWESRLAFRRHLPWGTSLFARAIVPAA